MDSTNEDMFLAEAWKEIAATYGLTSAEAQIKWKAAVIEAFQNGSDVPYLEDIMRTK